VTAALFTVPSDAVATTTDDCYTPRWVFDAMGLKFDLNVAAPVGGPWHVPCKQYYTAEDDGLVQPWDGLVWCNPPYSAMKDWAPRWVKHPTGVLVGLMLNAVRWLGPVLTAADSVAILPGLKFHLPGQEQLKAVGLRQVVFVAFRGVGVEPAERLAAADPYGAVLYGRGHR
jgi:hypothetical protein